MSEDKVHLDKHLEYRTVIITLPLHIIHQLNAMCVERTESRSTVLERLIREEIARRKEIQL